MDSNQLSEITLTGILVDGLNAEENISKVKISVKLMSSNLRNLAIFEHLKKITIFK